MAFVGPPGQFQYDLEGQPISFINSDDNKIFITGQPVTVLRVAAGPSPAKDSLALAGQTPARATGLQLEGQPVTIDTPTLLAPAPGTGTLEVDESSPFVAGIREPGTATLEIDEFTPTVFQPIDSDALAFSSDVVSLNRAAIPDTVSISLAGQPTERWTGLKFESEAVSLQFGIASPTLNRAVNISGSQPDPFVTGAGDSVAVPPTALMNVSGSTPTFGYGLTVLKGALSFAGKTPNIDPVAYPARQAMSIAGQDIQVPERIGIPTIEIGGPYEEGRIIRNLDATIDDARYEVCARSGFKQKRFGVNPDAYDVLTRADSGDRRHWSDIPHRVRRELHRGSPRPEGGDTFIDPDNPVDPEDY